MISYSARNESVTFSCHSAQEDVEINRDQRSFEIFTSVRERCNSRVENYILCLENK